MPKKVNFNTQIEIDTLLLLEEFLREEKERDPKVSKAGVTDAALKEYIEKRRAAK